MPENTKTIYARPVKLTLLTNEQIKALHDRDIELEKKAEADNVSWVPVSCYTRKWHSRMSDASYDWKLLQTITVDQLYEVIHWLSTEAEPCNESGCGRPGKIKELARDIKYCMSDKQRNVAYSIITKRYNAVAI